MISYNDVKNVSIDFNLHKVYMESTPSWGSDRLCLSTSSCSLWPKEAPQGQFQPYGSVLKVIVLMILILLCLCITILNFTFTRASRGLHWIMSKPSQWCRTSFPSIGASPRLSCISSFKTQIFLVWPQIHRNFCISANLTVEHAPFSRPTIYTIEHCKSNRRSIEHAIENARCLAPIHWPLFNSMPDPSSAPYTAPQFFLLRKSLPWSTFQAWN